jgi:hypothetical protein
MKYIMVLGQPLGTAEHAIRYADEPSKVCYNNPKLNKLGKKVFGSMPKYAYSITIDCEEGQYTYHDDFGKKIGSEEDMYFDFIKVFGS